MYDTTTSVELSAWADPDFRLWLALHLPNALLADHLDEQGNRTGVTVYTAAAKAVIDYTRGGAGAWPVTQDQARLWNTVEGAWAAWRRFGEPDRPRIGIAARADGAQYAWLDDPDGPMRWQVPVRYRP